MLYAEIERHTGVIFKSRDMTLYAAMAIQQNFGNTSKLDDNRSYRSQLIVERCVQRLENSASMNTSYYSSLAISS
jgi:hypothetical protein